MKREMLIVFVCLLLKGIIMEDMHKKMEQEAVFVKKGSELKQVADPGKLYRLMIKSKKMEAIVSELHPHAESRWYQHEGEEVHFMIQGEMDYTIGETIYHLCEGDVLWHTSTITHRAKNTTGKKISYITVGSPPTFM